MDLNLPTLTKTKKELIACDTFKQIIGIVPKNTWLLHFTAEPERIIKSGFIYGEAKPHRLGLTWDTHQKPKQHPGAGFNFAFEAVDEDGAGARWSPLAWPVASMTSDTALLFQAPGIACEHFDGFQQVIFRGQDANLTNAKILEFCELEDEGEIVRVYSPKKELLDSGLNDDYPEETIKRWCKA